MATLLNIKVQPRSRRPGVEKTPEGGYVVRVAAAPEKGRANKEVLERLAEELGVPVSRLEIVRGAAASRKVVRLNDAGGAR